MKRILILLALLLSFAMIGQAQTAEFEAITDEAYGLQGVIPLGWEARGFGSYARAASATDLTAIFLQAAPVDANTILQSLAPQLGISEIPDVARQIQGVLLWDVRLIEISAQGMEISVSLATAEFEGKTFIVLLQSPKEEHEALVAAYFDTVVMALAPLAEAEATEVPYPVEEVTFMSGDITLAGSLSIPEGEGPFPVAILISGSGPSNRDESLAPIAALRPFRDIADFLTRNGVAVLRYDDRGVGASEGNYASALLADLAADASAAVDYLVSRNEFSAIGFIGHSEGGIIAPYAAANNENVDFVIGLAAPAVNMDEVLIQQNRRLAEVAGIPAEEIDLIVGELRIAYDAVIANDDEALVNVITAQLERNGEEANQAVITSYIAQLKSFNTFGYFDWQVAEIWGAVTVPILGIYGDLDVQVDSLQNAPALEAITAANPDVTVLVYPTMNHVLQEAETGGIEEYGMLEQSVRLDVLEAVRDWILERF